jgi:hypothetical protein
MDSNIGLITALASAAGQRAADRYAIGILDGIELMLDHLAAQGVPSDEWMREVRDFLAIAKEHSL